MLKMNLRHSDSTQKFLKVLECPVIKKTCLTHFLPMFLFYTPRKHWEHLP